MLCFPEIQLLLTNHMLGVVEGVKGGGGSGLTKQAWVNNILKISRLFCGNLTFTYESMQYLLFVPVCGYTMLIKVILY